MLHFALAAHAGLGPPDVVVLFNADDPDSAAVADHYAAARDLPPGHTCGVTGVDPTALRVDLPTFDVIRSALEGCVGALPDPDEIDAVVTVRGLPYVVQLGASQVGFEAALQVGRGVGPGGELAGQEQGYGATIPNPTYAGMGTCDPGDLEVQNPYAGWYTSACVLQGEDALPRGFRRRAEHEAGGYDLTGELLVVTRLDGFDHDDAIALVDRSVASDGTAPDAEWLCMAGRDEARAARDPECELTTRRLTEAGWDGVWLPTHDGALTGHSVVAYFTGADGLHGSIDGVDYVPGAIVDNLTSYGAVPENFVCDETGATCPASESQTSIARFVRAGATGVHGTVFEPFNNPFPNGGALVLYASGYTLGESFLFGSRYLHWANLVLGDPLAAPFAVRPVVTVPAEVEVGGELQVDATHPDGVDAVRLFRDGVLVAEGVPAVWVPDVGAGESVELLAVAVASPGRVERAGWPADEQRVPAEVQGWTRATVTVVAAPAPDPVQGGEEPGGCGCDAAGSAPVGLSAALSLWFRRRRSG